MIMAVIQGTPQEEALAGAGAGDPISGNAAPVLSDAKRS
jgi:hypothetical protein